MDVDSYAAEVVGRAPSHLYKYKSLAGAARAHTRDLIVNQRLYFPAPDDLNDPFEAKPHLATSANISQQRKYIAGLVKRTQPSAARSERRRLTKQMREDRPNVMRTLVQSTSQSLQAVGIFSLSQDLASLLMWPHYADNHRGICVRFSMQALVDEDLVPLPVAYAEERPVCDTILEPTADWLTKAVLTKGSPWAYEREWRLVRTRGARELLTPSTAVVDGVLLGANASEEDRAEVKSWVRESGRVVAVAQARFHPTAYQIEIDNIE